MLGMGDQSAAEAGEGEEGGGEEHDCFFLGWIFAMKERELYESAFVEERVRGDIVEIGLLGVL